MATGLGGASTAKIPQHLEDGPEQETRRVRRGSRAMENPKPGRRVRAEDEDDIVAR